MNKELIKEVALGESSQFLINELKDGYMVKLSEEFKRWFPDEVLTTTHFFIDEAKKRFGNDINIQKKKDIVFISKDNQRMNEAEYKGKDVKLNKPMRGDVKKYKVFVKDPKTGNVKKVNFGDKNMEIKRDDPKRKKSFRARHKCHTAKDKTTPRYWSCRFWGKNPVSKLLNEIIEPDSIKVDGFEKKDHLCPKIWGDDMIMHDEVRKALLKISKEFIEYADLQNFKFKDVTLTGSLANYNWTEDSDLDVHILMDFSQISDDKELVGDYLKNKKTLWNEKLPITVKDHEVEMYVQDINEPHTSTGVYSLMNNGWLTKPIKEMVSLDVGNIQLKAADIINTIDELEDSKNAITSVDEIQRVWDKIKKMRKAGLDKDGEFSTENIVFKILRKNGYIEKLVNLKRDVLTKELTLENNSMYTSGGRHGNIVEGKLGDIIKKAKKTGMLTLGFVVGILAAGTADSGKLIQMGVPQELVKKAEGFIDTTKDSELYKTVSNSIDKIGKSNEKETYIN